jgi:cytidylate kinase
MSNHTVITIDGPAASGKSTVAREVASRIGFVLVNTGAMYRAVTWWILENGVSVEDESAILKLLDDTKFEWGIDGMESSIRINDIDPTPYLSRESVTKNVSALASLSGVRGKLVEVQRDYANRFNVVMEGRDIGSVVFPDTRFKFYIDASPEVRAKRRAAQGIPDEIASRDRFDSSRKQSPLRRAPDADVIDSSQLTIEGVVGEVIGRLKAKKSALLEPKESAE